MFIDCHVHLRDCEEKYKETIKHGLEVALDSGVDAVFDMPNTNPPLTTKKAITDRLLLAKAAEIKEVFYGIYAGVTADQEQVRQTIDIARKHKQIVGIKLYAGHSTNNMGVIHLSDQEKIYETLAKEGYTGVLAVHCEKESEMDKNEWNPLVPVSHCFARPEIAEIASVKDQIANTQKYNFKGKLHIAHISSPTAVKLVQQAKTQGLDISCGICPHHFIYDWEQMHKKDGLVWKMNPPLRSPQAREQMLNYLHEGKIDWIETDHAPHTLHEKTQYPFLSGITGLQHWPLFREFLRKNNFSEIQIEKTTFENVRKRFNLDIHKSERKIKDRKKDYPFNFYAPMEKILKEKK
ncbi:MAG: amidohydrolase family protein [Nanoarchaeota archaeon]